MRFYAYAHACSGGFPHPHFAQQPSGADAQKSPSPQTGTNAETSVSAPTGTERGASSTPDPVNKRPPAPFLARMRINPRIPVAIPSNRNRRCWNEAGSFATAETRQTIAVVGAGALACFVDGSVQWWLRARPK